MTNNTIFSAAVLVTLFASAPAFAEDQTEASFCAMTIETSTTVHDRPICKVVEHLQTALTELQALPPDGEDNRTLALKATQTALDHVQAYVSPMIIADPGTTPETDQK
jgi:hypothetical protein